jgi:4a-hydroxytetrahydrobiopterin dehydratase
MSEQGWRAFLAADGVDDWVVLHGGATAVFRVDSLPHAVRLAATIAETPGLDADTVVLTVTAASLGVRLTRDMWLLEPAHIEVARQVSHRAREAGAVADRAAVNEVQLAIAAKPDAIDVGFWRAVLGYSPASDDNAIDPLGHSSTVWMQDLDAARTLQHAMHVDVSVARGEAEARVAAAVAAGGRVVTDAAAPGAWILSDRAGNRVCVVSWPDGAVLPDQAD